MYSICEHDTTALEHASEVELLKPYRYYHDY